MSRRHDDCEPPPRRFPTSAIVALVAVGVAAVLTLAIVAALVVGGAGRTAPAYNASCPGCGKEFYLPEVGSMVEMAQRRPCPRCRTWYPRGIFYKDQ